MSSYWMASLNRKIKISLYIVERYFQNIANKPKCKSNKTDSNCLTLGEIQLQFFIHQIKDAYFFLLKKKKTYFFFLYNVVQRLILFDYLESMYFVEL